LGPTPATYSGELRGIFRSTNASQKILSVGAPGEGDDRRHQLYRAKSTEGDHPREESREKMGRGCNRAGDRSMSRKKNTNGTWGGKNQEERQTEERGMHLAGKGMRVRTGGGGSGIIN